jgi:predicted transcriptional regulator
LVEDVMSRKPFCVKKGANIAQVARTMGKERIGSAIVLDDSEQIIGIFTTTDGMLLLADLIDRRGGSGFDHRELPWESFPEYMSW